MSHYTEAIEHVKTLLNDLEEAHQTEIEQKHYGDNPKDCLYCKSIKAAEAFLSRVNTGEGLELGDAKGYSAAGGVVFDPTGKPVKRFDGPGAFRKALEFAGAASAGYFFTGGQG